MSGTIAITSRCFIAILVGFTVVTPCMGNDTAVITQAKDLLALSHEEANSARPVRIIGTVIGAAEGEQHAGLVHDGMACVYVRSDSLPELVWRRGDQVEVSGSSGPGGLAPIVVASSISTRGTAVMPEPVPTSYEELLFGGFNGQWIEMRGIIRSCNWRPDLTPPRTELMVATGGQQIYVRVAYAEMLAEQWVDATVRIRGICLHQYTDNRQAIIPRLWVPENEPVVKESGPTLPLFEGEPRSIRSLFQFSAKGSYGHRLLMEGEVVYFQKGSHIYVQDSSQCIRVNTTQDIDLKLGERIRVLGFPNKKEHAPQLDDSVCLKMGIVGKPPAPIPLKSLAGAFQLDPGLVKLTATVVGPVLHNEGWALSVESDGIRFPLFLPASSGAPPSVDLKPGTRIDVTGISLNTGYWMPDDGGWGFSSSFRILLRSAADLVIVGQPPWWTPQRLYFLLLSLVAASLVALAVVWSQGRARSRRQQAARRLAEGEFAAILNERNRIAREIHDTIAQDLSAIAAQLEVARSKLGRMNDAALVHINMAREAACSALQEARRSIWNMRSQVLEDRDLADALTRLLEQATHGTQTRGVSRVYGEVRRLPPALENNLLRIGQQAIHNAMRHGHPATLELTVDYSDSRVKLAVKDDGSGFDPKTSDSDLSNHFGLAGMRERIQQCGGTLQITTRLGKGTEIFCEVTIPGNEPIRS